MPQFESQQLRQVFGQYPTGVTIVTARDAKGEPVGMTANSFASVSMEPPLLSWCVDKACSVHDVFSLAEYFCVHFLTQDQQELSTNFAIKTENRFNNIEWVESQHGVPILPNCVATIECLTEAVHVAGDHSIILGRVLDVKAEDEKQPLVFHQGQYKRLHPPS